ncbi:hypothetical protein CKSOR_00193 [Candidatus Kinetoplastibacterium sorsogonicusi]|uniref:DUF218 domain-containing protein n=1 Tax=Candidatus Kinetoplastidibacterium kentomonadis TaxID=1576550 RepID=A0A3S7J9H6_9PROT|nr:YdcF family protein [Candidatus Kinetoplastibacterium sorsogonicusi]AWD32320.1 hypothetical protein CKSOR_00193 [Candidatus Kinetoplastibacterium sorsogonicusi]
MLNIKPLSLFIPPLNFGITICIVACILQKFKLKSIAKKFYLFSIFWITIWSLPITSLLIGGFLENINPPFDLNKKIKYDAIVVLGGHIRHGQTNWFSNYDKKTATTRIDVAAKLYFAGISKKIICSGGSLDGKISEAKYMSNIAKKNGILREDLYLEEKSRTTHENALFVNEQIKKLKLKNIILVTSALHMPRAKASFLNVGITNIIAAPTHSQIIWKKNKFNLIVPNYITLIASKTIIKEYVAIFIYWYRGWI